MINVFLYKLLLAVYFSLIVHVVIPLQTKGRILNTHHHSDFSCYQMNTLEGKGHKCQFDDPLGFWPANSLLPEGFWGEEVFEILHVGPLRVVIYQNPPKSQFRQIWHLCPFPSKVFKCGFTFYISSKQQSLL